MKNGEKYAVVLGASKRLGRLIALYLAERSYHVAIHYKHDEKNALETVQGVLKLGRTSFALQGDITCNDQIDSIFETILSRFDHIDLVVNCISLFTRGEIQQVDEDHFDTDQAIHQKGPFFLTQALYTIAKKHKWQVALIHLTDAHTRHPKPSRPSYYIAKSALESQIRTLSVSVAPYVRINGIAPGLILPNNEKEALYFAKREQEIPMKALATASDIAHTVYFLAENRALCGQTLIVDGGEWLL